MAELGDSLERMSFMQLLLLFGFVTAYMVSVGGLFGGRVRLRAACLSLALAVAFAAQTDPWVHGALLVVFVVAGMGLFVLLSWLLARLLGPRQAPQPVPTELPDESVPSSTQPPPQTVRPAPKLARRARVTR